MKRCIVCGQMKEQNLLILGKAICADCEWNIVRSRVHDQGYSEYVRAVSALQKRCVKAE